MIALFDNLAVIHYANAVEMFQAVQTVRHQDQRLALTMPAQQRQDLLFGFGVQPFGRFVKQQQRGRMQQRAGDTQSALFAAGQLPAAFAQPGVQPAVAVQQFAQPNLLQYVTQASVVGIRCGQPQVFPQRIAEDMHSLADDRGHPTQRGFIIILQRFAVEQNFAAVGAPGAGQQLQQGGLAAAGLRHGKKDFFTYNMDSLVQTAEKTTRTLQLFLTLVAVISLVVGGIGVMNIMLVSVTERTREIGIRMAVGARSGDVLQQFLIEAVLVCLVGGALGITLSFAIGLAVQLVLPGWQISFPPAALLSAFLCSTGIGVVFGYLPARNAARLNPIDALARE